MGCDIHLVVERRVNGKWEIVKPEGKRKYDHHNYNWDFDRSYDSFAVMANVRNGYGFAGTPTGTGFVPISEPRGIPDDASEIVKLMKNDELPKEEDCCDWLGDHSFSWLTLDEIKSYHWEFTSRKQGCLPVETYKNWREKKGWPTGEYCSFSYGRDVRILTNAEMDAYLEKPVKDGLSRYTMCEWEAPYKECADRLWDLVEELDKLNLAAPKDIRLVFGFDS